MSQEHFYPLLSICISQTVNSKMKPTQNHMVLPSIWRIDREIAFRDRPHLFLVIRTFYKLPYVCQMPTSSTLTMQPLIPAHVRPWCLLLCYWTRGSASQAIAISTFETTWTTYMKLQRCVCRRAPLQFLSNWIDCQISSCLHENDQGQRDLWI